MDYRIAQTTPPANQPVTLTRMKHHLRVDGDDEDQLIETQLAAATRWVEEFTSRQLVTASWTLTLDRWPIGDAIRLPRPPALAVTSITYHRSDGTDDTMDPDDYELDNRDDYTTARLYLAYGASWPSVVLRRYAGIEILYTAGYGTDPDDVPEVFRSGIKAAAGSLYENRETEIVGKVAAQLRFSTEALLWPYRVFL